MLSGYYSLYNSQKIMYSKFDAEYRGNIWNKWGVVEVNVAKMTSEFSESDYEKFNKSLCQYLDSIELAMYR